jgi:sugar/nucleoside kinase (ribokinase family)
MTQTDQEEFIKDIPTYIDPKEIVDTNGAGDGKYIM